MQLKEAKKILDNVGYNIHMVSKKDIVIPKGTIFKNIDGSKSEFIHDNYDTLIALDKDTSTRIIVSSENEEYFERKEMM